MTVGSGRRPRLSPSYPLFMSSCVGTGAPTPGPLSPTLRATPPGRLPTGGGAARTTAPQVEGAGRMPYWAPALLLAHRARLAGPPRKRGNTPGPRCRVHRTATACTPLPRWGRPPRSGAAIAGEDRGSTRAPHWGARRLAVLARPPHLGGPAPLALGRRGGDPFRRGNCDGPSHGPPTPRKPDSPEICLTNAYFKLFRWRPTCDQLVAYQPQPQSQYFPGIRNPPERAPT